MNSMWAWLLLLLGAYHGLNPAMGWLFAVWLGMQEKNGRAVVKALLPLGFGHLASVALVVGVAVAAQLTMPLRTVKIVAAVALIGFALYRVIRRRHPRWVGMQVKPRELAFWSFLMATAHGAGLMLLPFVVNAPQSSMPAGHDHHAMMMTQAAHMHSAAVMPAVASAGSALAQQWWLTVGLHTLGYLLITALVALIVYHKVGVAVLRRAWVNLEWLWVGALFLMGVLTLML